jgi:two-component system LytT family response regulator
MDGFPALIVDDELQSRSLIKKLLAVHFPNIISDEAETVSNAVEKIQQLSPKLIFLDVQMRGETGFDLLDKIGKGDFEIIFTTAHSEFALKAFRYSALDYLIKPIDAEEFRSAVEKAIERIKKQQSQVKQIEFLKELRSNQKTPDKLTVPTAEGFLFLSITEILYCHAVGNYTEFHLTNHQKTLSSYTLGYYNEVLKSHSFFRVHRSYLVNLSHIKMYKKGDGGVLVMNNGDEIEVARSTKEDFLKIMKL